eukprot:m.198578 g.198578  ORF g.198578 m.198578 type:complete len:57 (-) comp15717_c0_seq19:733-903(-)
MTYSPCLISYWLIQYLGKGYYSTIMLLIIYFQVINNWKFVATNKMISNFKSFQSLA